MVATTLMLRRTPGELAQRLPGNLGDSAEVMWILQWGFHGLLHSPRHVFNGNIFWPWPDTLAYADSLLSIAPLYGILYALSGSWALSWNLIWIGLLLLNQAATYSLARWLTKRTDAAIFAGLAVGFSAYITNNAQHPQLQLIGFVPLGILLLFKLLERPRWSIAVAFGVVNVIIGLGALYIATGYVIAVVILLGGFAVAIRGRFDRRLLAALAVAAAISLIAAPSVIPYHRVEQTFPERPLEPTWGLRLRDLVRATPGSYAYRTLAHDTDSGSGERHAFPGFSTMVLATLGLAVLIVEGLRRPVGRAVHRGQDHTLPPYRNRFAVLLTIEGAVLGVLAIGAVSSGFPTPWKILYDSIRPLAGVRVPARLVAFTILSLGVLAAIGLAAILRRIPSAVARVALTAALCGVVLVELAAPIPYTHIPADAATLAVYHELAHLPKGPLVELPMFNPATDPTDWAFGEPSRLVWNTIDFDPTVNGYSGYISPTYVSDATLFATLPSPGAVARLRALKVRYLILHLGVQTGIQMFTAAQAQSIVNGLPGASAQQYGSNILVTLRT